jgi:hypothetical protein
MAGLIAEVRLWVGEEMCAGHELGAEDVMDEFVVRLTDEIWHLEEKSTTEDLAACEAKF